MSKKINEGVRVLKGLEGVRLRYGMYAGSNPVQHMIKEVIDNSSDEYFKGICTEIKITVDTKKNYIRVEDNGSGLPNAWNEEENESNLYLLTQKLHAGTKFDDNDGEQRSGMNGIGIKIISALCEWGKTTSERNGERRCIEYSKGNVIGKVKDLKKTGKCGTITEFIPDKELLGELAIIDIEKLKENLKLRSYLNSGLRIILKIDGKITEYYSEEGVKSYIKDTIENPLYNMEPIILKETIEGNYYEIALNYSNTIDEKIIGFANSVILDRGTHEVSLKTVLTRIFTNFINEKELLNKKDKNLSIKGEDIRKGLNCIVNMRILNPLYSSQTKNELSNKEVGTHITKLFNDKFIEWISNNENLMKKLCLRVIQFAKATESIKKAQEKIVRNTSNSTLNFSNKYIDCLSKDPNQKELFIVEGKSAGGSVSAGRDGEYQAVYMLKGKPLNAYNVQHSTLISNFEFNELMQIIFGTNSIKDVDYSKINFDKVIFLADSDDDGAHIVSLLSMAFKEHFKKLIDDGKIYVGCPPKYSIVNNGKYIYFKNDKEFNQYKAKYVSNLYSIKTKGIKMIDIVNKIDEFIIEFNRTKNKYGLTNDLLSSFMTNGIDQTAEDISDELEVLYYEDSDEYHIQGLFNDAWLDLICDKQFKNEIKNLVDIYGVSSLLIAETNGDEFEGDIFDIIELINKSFKFHRSRFKGLGESLPSELAETALDPKTRDIIKLSISDNNKSDDLTKILFHSNSDPRKEFIQKKLLNWIEEE